MRIACHQVIMQEQQQQHQDEIEQAIRTEVPRASRVTRAQGEGRREERKVALVEKTAVVSR